MNITLTGRIAICLIAWAGRSAAGVDTVQLAATVAISHVNQLPPDDVSVDVDPAAPLELRGTFTTPTGLKQPLAVHLIIRRVYDGEVFVTEPSVIASGHGPRGSSTWSYPGVRLTGPDLGKGWEISAVATRVGELGPGTADYDTVRRIALGWSAPVRIVAAQPSAAVPPSGACAIEIKSVRAVSGEVVRALASATEVGLLTDLTGVIDRPRGSYVVIAVKPVASDRVWLMPHNYTDSARRWRGTAYLGREGLDFGEQFVISAWILSRPVTEDRSYSAAEWRLLEDLACAKSADVIVRRRVSPGDLKVTKVGDTMLSDISGPIVTTTEPNVEGTVEDLQSAYAIKPGETVWLLSRLVGSEGWRVASLAVVQPDRLGWRVPAMRFLQPGDHHLMAVAATTRLPLGKTLTPQDWYRLAQTNLIRRLSRTVTVQPVREGK